MTGTKIEPCLICDGKMRHSEPGNLALWYCENHNDCDYRFVDSETNVEYHNERYGIIQLGKVAKKFMEKPPMPPVVPIHKDDPPTIVPAVFSQGFDYGVQACLDMLTSPEPCEGFTEKGGE